MTRESRPAGPLPRSGRTGSGEGVEHDIFTARAVADGVRHQSSRLDGRVHFQRPLRPAPRLEMPG